MSARTGRPLIGVATPQRLTPSWPFIAFSIWLAGGRARRLPPDTPAHRIAEIEGLVVGGGDDIGADLYGGRVVLDSKVDPDRDRAEQALLSRFWPTDLPILGICRGAQMLNVVRGGTLHGDIYAVYRGAPRMWTPLPLKRVEIAQGTRLAAVAGVERLKVNSLHHQSVAATGADLRISARDQIGIVQAIEHTEPTLRIGVQWHPEFLFYKGPHRRLFRSLVAAARALRGAAERSVERSAPTAADAPDGDGEPVARAPFGPAARGT